MNLMLMSEVFPTWNNDLLSFLASPEELLYDNPIGLIGSAEECAQESLGAQPIDNEYWTAGCWGCSIRWSAPISTATIPYRRPVWMCHG